MAKVPFESDTNVAISTPPGAALRAIVRLSGPLTLEVLRATVDPVEGPPVLASRLRLSGGLGLPGTLVKLRAPRTYTREDVAEFHTFGSPPLLESAVSAFVAAGARLAEPGEFTRRAFRNGRIDLTQAEAVLDLIHARSEAERRAATQALAGRFGRSVERAKERLLDLIALVETSLDFSDQDIEIVSDGEVVSKIDELRSDVEGLCGPRAGSTGEGEWPRVVLCGAPNAGKSSLLNALVGCDRSLVTEVAGTTLDSVEVELPLGGGACVLLVDTPGFANAADELHAEAERRAQSQLDAAALCVLVADASLASPPCERPGIERRGDLSGRRVLEVFSKLDLVDSRRRRDLEGSIAVSALTGEGLDRLRQEIRARAADCEISPALASATRHHDCLMRAALALAEASRAETAGMPLEAVAVDLREALDALGEIVGAVSTEDLLGRIFGRFCIGK